MKDDFCPNSARVSGVCDPNLLCVRIAQMWSVFRWFNVLCLFLMPMVAAAEPVSFQGANSNATNETPSLTVATPENIEAGDLLVAHVAFRGPSGRFFTPDPGWQEFAPRINITSRGDGQNQALYYRIVSEDEPADSTWEIGEVDHFVIVVTAFRNVDTDDPILEFGRQTQDTQNPVAPSITVEGVATGERTAACDGAGGGRPNAGHLVALNPDSSDQTFLVGAWSRAHAQTCEPLEEEMTRPEGATDSDGRGNNGIRATSAYERFTIEGAARLAFDGQPSDTPVDQTISPEVTVRIEDPQGNLVTDAENEVTVSIGDNPGDGELNGTRTVAAEDGIATFPDLSINAVGEGYTLIAESPELDFDESAFFDITELQQGANAFDPDTPEGSIVGDIRTRIAAEPFALDIVAIDDGEVDEQFNKGVEMFLLDASDNSGELDENGCRDSWEEIGLAGTLDFGPGDDGRKTLDNIMETEAWREVRVRIDTLPPGQGSGQGSGQAGPIGCSSDAFAIRPDAFVDVEAFHEDADGNRIVLDHADPDIDRFLAAGTPFSLEATAVNAEGEITERYDGSPDITLVIERCLEADGQCVEGTLSAGNWTADRGDLFNDDVRYDEVGGFEIIIEDREFAAIDSDDTNEEGRFITSDTQNPPVVGRFVPDHFVQSVASAGEFQHTCNGVFTYLGQTFGYSSRPALTITARNTAGEITQNYTGEFAVLRAEDIERAGPTSDGSQEDRAGDELSVGSELRAGDITDNNDGTLTYTFAHGETDGDRYRYDPDGTRSADLLVAPFDTDLTITIEAIVDRDAVAATTLADVEPNSVEIRFGRLNIDGAVGSELADLALPLRAEYWDGNTWLVHDADDCTVVGLADHVRLTSSGGDENVPGNESVDLDSGQTSLVAGTDDPLTLDDGRGEFVFSAPGAGNVGWVDLRTNLDAAELEFLGDGSDAEGAFTGDPQGRASFGLFGGNPSQIYREEVLR